MIKLNKGFLILVLGFSSSWAFSSDDMKTMSILEAFKIPDANTQIGSSVDFYFGEKPENIKGGTTTTSKVTRKVARSKPDSCHRAFVEAMLVFKEQALSKGSKSVVNIVSNFDNKPLVSKETYQCSMSMLSAEVNLKGEIIWGAEPAPIQAVTPSPESAPAAGGSIEDRLKTLKALFESGAIDQETYDAKKAKIIDSI